MFPISFMVSAFEPLTSSLQSRPATLMPRPFRDQPRIWWANPSAFTVQPLKSHLDLDETRTTLKVWSVILNGHPMGQMMQLKGQRSQFCLTKNLNNRKWEWEETRHAGSYNPALLHSHNHSVTRILPRTCLEIPLVLDGHTRQPVCRVSAACSEARTVQWGTTSVCFTSLCFISLPTPYSHLISWL